MKKVLFMLLSFILFISGVEAYEIIEREQYDEERVYIEPGEIFVPDSRFSNINCQSFDKRFSITSRNRGCVFINTGYPYSVMGTVRNSVRERVLERDENGEVLLLERTHVRTQYRLIWSDDRPTHSNGKTSLDELALNIKLQTPVGSRIEGKLYEAARGEPVLAAAVEGNSLVVFAGRRGSAFEYRFNYNGSSNTLVYNYEGNSNNDEVKIAKVLVDNIYYFLLQSQESGSEAVEIMMSREKSSYVKEEDITDNVSDIENYDDASTGRTRLSFNILLSDTQAEEIVESYQANAPRAPEPEEPEPSNPPVTTDPEEPTQDPTQPTQPNQAVTPPNTGTYLSVLGIIVLLSVAFVIVFKNKSKFNKI